jgi:hypothetical protein
VSGLGGRCCPEYVATVLSVAGVDVVVDVDLDGDVDVDMDGITHKPSST